jgi:hypothetical protein
MNQSLEEIEQYGAASTILGIIVLTLFIVVPMALIFGSRPNKKQETDYYNGCRKQREKDHDNDPHEFI